MNKDMPDFEYVTYIATTPQKLWIALTAGDMTKQYFFGRRIESDWRVGSPWTLWMEDGRIDCNGTVLESDAPRLADDYERPEDPA